MHNNLNTLHGNAPTLIASSDIRSSLVPSADFEGMYEKRTYQRVDLIFEKGSYNLCLHTKNEVLLVARQEGDLPRKWRDVNRALDFIKQQIGPMEVIYLLYPPNPGESKCS